MHMPASHSRATTALPSAPGSQKGRGAAKSASAIRTCSAKLPCSPRPRAAQQQVPTPARRCLVQCLPASLPRYGAKSRQSGCLISQAGLFIALASASCSKHSPHSSFRRVCRGRPCRRRIAKAHGYSTHHRVREQTMAAAAAGERARSISRCHSAASLRPLPAALLPGAIASV